MNHEVTGLQVGHGVDARCAAVARERYGGFYGPFLELPESYADG